MADGGAGAPRGLLETASHEVASGMRLARLVRRAVAVGSLALVAVIVTFVGLYVKHRDAARWVEHSRLVERLAREARKLSLDRQTGVRGFLLTSDSTTLQPEFEARVPLRATLDSLQRLTADNPPQAARAKAIAEQTGVWEREFVDRALDGAPDTGALAIDHARGKREFDLLRLLYAQFIAAEARLYAARRDYDEKLQRWALLAVALEAGAILLALRVLGRGVANQARTLEVQQGQLEEQAAELERQTEVARSAALTLKGANAALSESESRYRAFVDAAPQLAWSSDADGGAAFFNARWSEYTGLDPSNSSADPWNEVVHPDDRARLLEAREAAFRSGAPYEVDIRLRRRDGVHRWFSSRVVPLRDQHGTVVAWYGVSLDVDEQRRASDALTQANRELATTTYTIAHDLRSPLRAIDGYSRMLELDYGPALGREARNLITRIRANSQRMGQLIDGVLSLARLGRGDLECTRVDLSAMARHAVEDLRRAEPGRCVQVRIEPGLVVEADARLMALVLDNLLGNAWKFTRRNEEEGRPPALVEVGRLPPGSVVPPRENGTSSAREIALPIHYVRDNGAGFDPAHASRLFGAFQRLHHEDQYEGHGIGLASVRRVVERHGGRTWAAGALDNGATIYFTIAEDGCRAAASTPGMPGLPGSFAT